jgi:hypothetical protein
MKRIKNLAVKTSYMVDLDGLKVPNNIFSGLCKISEGGISDKENKEIDDEEINAAFEWLSNNIKEEDAETWGYSIYSLQQE